MHIRLSIQHCVMSWMTAVVNLSVLHVLVKLINQAFILFIFYSNSEAADLNTFTYC